MSKTVIKRTSILLAAALIGLASYLYLRPLPIAAPSYQAMDPVISSGVSLPWPPYGQSAIGAPGYGVLATAGSQTPAPIASVAKVVTALAVLKQKPLSVGEKGPIITIDKTDLDYYSYYYSNDGSVAKVSIGEQLTEYEALQALLLPSANNIADSLARWAFGSVENYVTYANAMAKDLGLTQTVVDGASGFTSATKSTAADLVELGIEAVNNPIIAEIVNQQTATIPVTGLVHNVNWLLGVDGVNGIKTGNTTEAGGCFLFSAKRVVAGQDMVIVGAIIGAPDLNKAISDARPILTASDSGFEKIKVVTKGQVAGSYKAPWGASTNAVATRDISILAWKGQKIEPSVVLSSLGLTKKAGTNVGEIKVKYNNSEYSSPVILENKIANPSLAWRLFHR